jgi:TRAP-type transport system periplasmic protein
MNKKLITVIACILLLSTASWSMAGMKLKMGLTPPPDHPHTKSVIAFAEYVKAKTNGEITIDVFPMGQLGGERSMVEQVQSGTLDLACITTAVLSNYVPQVAVIDMHFIWPSRGVAYSVLGDSQFWQIISDLFPQKGMVAFGYGQNEFRDLTNTVKPIRKPEDVKGLKIRVQESPIFLDTWRELGANPIPMPFPEVYTALQQGVINAQENPILTSVLMKFTEVCGHVTILQYSLTETIKIANADVWKRLTQQQQEIFRQGAEIAIKHNREGTLYMMDKLVADLEASGKATIQRLTPEERAAFFKAVQPVYVKYEKSLGAIPKKEEYGRFGGMSYLQMVQEKVKQYQ